MRGKKKTWEKKKKGKKKKGGKEKSKNNKNKKSNFCQSSMQTTPFEANFKNKTLRKCAKNLVRTLFSGVHNIYVDNKVTQNRAVYYDNVTQVREQSRCSRCKHYESRVWQN